MMPSFAAIFRQSHALDAAFGAVEDAPPAARSMLIMPTTKKESIARLSRQSADKVLSREMTMRHICALIFIWAAAAEATDAEGATGHATARIPPPVAAEDVKMDAHIGVRRFRFAH